MKKLIIAGLVASALGTVSVPASAHVAYFVNVPPPAPVVEVVPAPRVGYVWAPGYWVWRHGHHVWVRGHYLRHRPGYFYQPAHWVARDGRWYYSEGYWRR